ncbi:MAG: 14.7 kDa ribonuclease H-like protein [Syntrophorhabdus sp. PtaU1.Bin153]|nr:MAG: 14.7 kDa ribonuclease H-like protein [Syntrophorhabdus sp. PtaU1.Bin153]
MTEWHIYIDGASSCNPGESGAGIVVYDRNGTEIDRKSVYLGEMTNNMAEYEALLYALKEAESASVNNVFIYTDSLLVANQIPGKYKTNNATLRKYVERARNIIQTFNRFELRYIRREKNIVADKLAKEAANRKGVGG